MPDPKRREELIYMLDRSLRVGTMGALFFLSHDDCTVHWCALPDKVTVLYHRGQREGVFEVVGFAEGKQKTLFGGLVRKGYWLFKCWPWTLVNSRYTVLK